MRIAGLLIVALLAGCGNNERRQTIVTDNGKAEITTREDGGAATMNLTGEKGEQASFSSGTGSKWPSKWPDFAPAYPGAEVSASMSGTSAEGLGGMVSFTTGDSPDQVIDFYKARAAGTGMATQATIDSGESRTFSAGDEAHGRSLSVSVSRADGKTNVTLMAGAKQ